MNRWYDKLQLIVCANGAAGINFEHSAVDGHTVLRFVSDMFADTIVKFARSITKGTHGSEYIKPICGHGNFFRASTAINSKERNGSIDGTSVDVSPKKMNFVLNTELRGHSLFERQDLGSSIADELRVLEFSDFGKLWIVSRGISDAFVQVAMCTSYFILYSQFASQYESVMTKAFFHGRTEAGRSCTRRRQICGSWVDAAVLCQHLRQRCRCRCDHGDRKNSSDRSEPEDASSLSAIGEERAERLRNYRSNQAPSKWCQLCKVKVLTGTCMG